MQEKVYKSQKFFYEVCLNVVLVKVAEEKDVIISELCEVLHIYLF